MAGNKIKAEVRIDDDEGASDLDLELTPDQAVVVLQAVVAGKTLFLNLQPLVNGQLREDPKAYAQ